SDPGSFNSISINGTYIKQAVKNLKCGKATGVDNIPAEFLKMGGERVIQALLKLFLKVKLLEELPNDWYEGIIKPLFKEGSREELGNYRGITISSIVYKTLVSIIEMQTMSFLESNGKLGDLQGAFRKNRRCEDQIFNLKGICSIRKSNKKKTYLGFLDVSKAFDTVDRMSLFNHLWHTGIQGKAWKMIKLLYNRVFQVTNGVKQGCILSPCLFNLV
ncbi:MAG: reverse transcriptase family protein, partial [Bacteroidetes bacterium]|nr:reverse transcriptase family protein [Bacteroidota bacterium]